MSAKTHPAVGIDLGTTFSVISQLDDLGRPQTLINAEGDKITPSVVLFEGEGNVVVGKEAVKAIATDAENVAECAKRDLGSQFFHKLLGGRRYPPEALQAFILNKLRVDAAKQIGQFSKVVITVPAYFDEVRRKATKDAGYIAGFEVMDIINEPTAAAVAFGFQQGFMNPANKDQERKKILVYDLGGGTFDVTVMEIGGRNFNALATDGDVHARRQGLGSAARRFRRRGVHPQIRTRSARGAEQQRPPVARVRRRQTDAVGPDEGHHRLRLSGKRGARGDHAAAVPRHDAGLARSDGLHHAADAAGRRAGMEGHRPGAARWRIEPDAGGRRNAATTLGQRAGLQRVARRGGGSRRGTARGVAARPIHEGKSPNFHIRNVNSHSLGVVATDAKTRRTRNAILIPRNTPLPVVARRVFKTQRAGQKSILVQIVEGESLSPDDCSQLGKCSVRDLPDNLPAQTPIEVRFRYEENGRLTVVVKVEGTGKQLKHEITRENSLSQEELDSWRKYISGLGPAAEVPPANLSGEAVQVQPNPKTLGDNIDFTEPEDTEKPKPRPAAMHAPEGDESKKRWA